MEVRPKDDKSNQPDQRPTRHLPKIVMGFAIGAMALMVVMQVIGCTQPDQIDTSFFYEQVEAGNIESVQIGEGTASGKFVKPPEKPAKLDKDGKVDPKAKTETYSKEFWVRLGKGDTANGQLVALLRKNDVKFSNQPEDYSGTILMVVLFLMPIALILFLWLSFRRKSNEMMGGGFLSGFSKSTAKRYEPARHPITFKDVAGLEGVKADLMEIVDYLKSPDKFRKLGGRIPRGVLLAGPPGTGKTLLARAVAGEAGVPFYSVNGSEFIQMFVGVGASRVRDLFATAKETAPSIIFVDEIDAVGRQRGAGLGGGHDEREQTLNQILSEMDGFNPNDAAIVVAATNRPDVLDPALLRPGRFDRHVMVNRPTKNGRHEIFKVHVRDVPLAADVDLSRLASQTIGMTGADIRNVVNEAALWAARHDKSVVGPEDFDYALDKVRLGAKREDTLIGKEKEITAYHEAGHCLLGWTLPGAHRVHKVTIIPRGRAAGLVQSLPEEDKMNHSQSELIDILTMTLGGRAAEQVIFNELSVGAQQDLEQATSIARRMVTLWGMSKKLGPVSYKMNDEDPFLGREMHQQRPFSDHTMELIDEEVAKILHESADRAVQLLKDNREQLETLAQGLLDSEELEDHQIAELIGPSIHSQMDAAETNGKPSIVQSPTEREAGSTNNDS